jgi:hypothetical protein
MKNKPRKVFERVYIHAAKVQTKEGWVLVVHSMDAFSEFAFKAVLYKSLQITLDVLNELFDNIFKEYKPLFHPKHIVFITNISEEFEPLFKQTKASHHKFIFNKEATASGMEVLLKGMPYNMAEL